MSLTPFEIRGEDAARELTSSIVDPARERPVVVITRSARGELIDAGQVADQCGDLADVYVLRNVATGWAFSNSLPKTLNVFGGAGRVYPVGVDRDGGIRPPVRLAANSDEGTRSARRLIDDALRCAAQAGLLSRDESARRPVTGKVVNVLERRALVRTSDGETLMIAGELLLPGVAIERILTSGQSVNGWRQGDKRLDIREMVRPGSELDYHNGDVILARVAAVSADSATLELHPDVQVRLARADVTPNEHDDLVDLMARGEVLRARVVGVEPWALSLHDLDDDEDAAEAFALTAGGPPWLVEGLPDPIGPPEPAPASAPRIEPEPTPSQVHRILSTAGERLAARTERVREVIEKAPKAPRVLRDHESQVARLRKEIATLTSELEQVDTRRIDAAKQRKMFEEQLNVLRKKGRQRDGHNRNLLHLDDWFEDDEDRFRFEVHLAWARWIGRSDKRNLPMMPYEIGPGFMKSVRSLQGVSRDRIARTVVKAITGVAESASGARLHRSHVAGGGSTKRADGSVLMRAAIQGDGPSARRLHYWLGDNGRIELDKVAVHDDF